ncbi:TniQ family protein [Kitasatospora sp. CMC57]|uniref:TniQ family protein n=1 Tax=Kitasatospora sp. CMC57 TaxID=3231513 RepID=UPI0038B55189
MSELSWCGKLLVCYSAQKLPWSVALLAGRAVGTGVVVDGGWQPEAWWVPSKPEPLRVRFVAYESTSSYLWRLAGANGRNPDDLLQDVGEGDPGRKALAPSLAEVYLSRPALERLSVLAGCAPHTLQRALPNLREPLLLPGHRPRWHWPWAPQAGSLVRACPLCAASRGAGGGVWLAWPDPWKVCLRHRRWTDGTRDDARGSFDLTPVPEVLRAHRYRLLLECRFGPGGAALVADAFAIVGWWWRQAPQAPLWRLREQRAGLGSGAVSTAPLLVYPEAAALARVLLGFERERRSVLEGGWDDGRGREAGESRRAALLYRLEVLASLAGVDAAVGRVPVVEWLSRHHRLVREAASPVLLGAGPRRGPVRCAVHADDAPHTSVDARSCLPWQWTNLHERI